MVSRCKWTSRSERDRARTNVTNNSSTRTMYHVAFCTCDSTHSFIFMIVCFVIYPFAIKFVFFFIIPSSLYIVWLKSKMKWINKREIENRREREEYSFAPLQMVNKVLRNQPKKGIAMVSFDHCDTNNTQHTQHGQTDRHISIWIQRRYFICACICL